jgi:nicotinamidase-related amidase
MKVLLVVDVQNDFVTGALANPEAQKCIPRIKEKIQQRLDEGWKVMFTQDTHDEDYLDSSEGKYLPFVHCVNWTWGWQIVDELKEFIEPHSTIIKKRFGLNDLDRQIYLNMPGSWSFAQDPITEIELIGFCTDICVVSNALILKADVIRDHTIISCDASCCAGTSIEAHNAALTVMKSCQVEVINEQRDSNE